METKKDNKYHVFQFHEAKTFTELLYSQKNKHKNPLLSNVKRNEAILNCCGLESNQCRRE